MSFRLLVSALVLVTACGGVVADPGSEEASSASLTVERGTDVHSGYTCAAEETTAFTGHGAIFVRTICRAPTGDLPLRLELDDAQVGTWEGEEANRRASAEVGERTARSALPKVDPRSKVSLDAIDRERRTVTGRLDLRFVHDGVAFRVRGPIGLAYPTPN